MRHSIKAPSADLMKHKDLQLDDHILICLKFIGYARRAVTKINTQLRNTV